MVMYENRCWRGDASVLIGLAFVVVPFFPSTNLVFPVGFVIAERVLYIPSVGFCFLLAGWLAEVVDRKSSNRPVSEQKASAYRSYWRVVVFIVILYSVRTVVRNHDWSTRARYV